MTIQAHLSQLGPLYHNKLTHLQLYSIMRLFNFGRGRGLLVQNAPLAKLLSIWMGGVGVNQP